MGYVQQREELESPAATLPEPSDEPWDIDALLAAMERHGMEVLGPPLGME